MQFLRGWPCSPNSPLSWYLSGGQVPSPISKEIKKSMWWWWQKKNYQLAQIWQRHWKSILACWNSLIHGWGATFDIKIINTGDNFQHSNYQIIDTGGSLQHSNYQIINMGGNLQHKLFISSTMNPSTFLKIN